MERFIPVIRSPRSVFTLPTWGLSFSLAASRSSPGSWAVWGSSSVGLEWHHHSLTSTDTGNGTDQCNFSRTTPVRRPVLSPWSQRTSPPVPLPITSSLIHTLLSWPAPHPQHRLAISCMSRHGTVCLLRAPLSLLPPHRILCKLLLLW